MEEEIKTININDPDYPALLKGISSPPKTLYARGKFISDEACIAVVGTRRCSDYGKSAAFSIVQGLIDAGVTIISGLAPGIDTVAHEIAVENGARTIAVLGTGLDKKSIYPQTNVVLADRIVENNGLLLSEYPPGTPGAKYTFPQRNRIISGLSHGVLIIEAKEKSGSLITADWAKKQGRAVFAVPGPIHSQNSRGCNALIKQGALLVDSAEDILKALNIAPRKARPRRAADADAEEAKIIGALTEEPLDADKIIIRTGLPAKKILSLLPVMEIKGLIRDLGGGVYCLKQ